MNVLVFSFVLSFGAVKILQSLTLRVFCDSEFLVYFLMIGKMKKKIGKTLMFMQHKFEII